MVAWRGDLVAVTGWRRTSALVTALALALAACSPGESDTPQAEQDSPPPAPAVTMPLETGASESEPTSGPTVPGQWDPKSWEPTVHVSQVRLSAADREQWRTEYLAGMARDLDGSAPNVALERWVHPRAEWDSVMSGCMTDSGFALEVEDGSISYPAGPPPADQLSAWDLAWYECNARFTPDPDYSQDWTQEQIGLVYDYWDQYFIPCMEAHGVPVNRANQPSRFS